MITRKEFEQAWNDALRFPVTPVENSRSVGGYFSVDMINKERLFKSLGTEKVITIGESRFVAAISDCIDEYLKGYPSAKVLEFYRFGKMLGLRLGFGEEK